MTVLTLRYQRGHFTVSGPDFEMRRFETRREARDWCAQNYPGSPIKDTEPTRPSEWLKGAEAICLNDRSKYLGRRLGTQPKDEAEHFIKCEAR